MCLLLKGKVFLLAPGVLEAFYAARWSRARINSSYEYVKWLNGGGGGEVQTEGGRHAN